MWSQQNLITQRCLLFSTPELAEMVKLAFQALVQKCYVMRHTNRPSTAGEESSDEATSPSHPPAAASFAPLPEPLLQGACTTGIAS